MGRFPNCPRCGRTMLQRGRYGDFSCECCDESVRCPHVGAWTRLMRRLAGRKV